MGEASDNGIPRGALLVVAVGLIATVAAALLATDRSAGASPRLEWVQESSLPDSAPAAVPGAGGEQIRLTDGDIRATGTNFFGYALLRTAAVLRIDAGAPVGSGRIRCTVRSPRSHVARNSDLRAIFPRSSEKLEAQKVPETAFVNFSSHGAGSAVLELDDLFEAGFTPIEGVKVEWPTFREGEESWEWFLPSGRPEVDLVLPFAAVWKTTAVPAARISCTLTVAAGTATVRTGGALPERSPLLDEESEELREEAEEAQEAEEAAEATEEAE